MNAKVMAIQINVDASFLTRLHLSCDCWRRWWWCSISKMHLMITALLLYFISNYLLVHYTTEPQNGMYKQEINPQKW